jgi:hypothetical protein
MQYKLQHLSMSFRFLIILHNLFIENYIKYIFLYVNYKTIIHPISHILILSFIFIKIITKYTLLTVIVVIVIGNDNINLKSKYT